MSICIATGYCYNLIVIPTLIIVLLLCFYVLAIPISCVIIFWCFIKSWRYLWILISGNYITLNTFFPNAEKIINFKSYSSRGDTRWFSWLRHGATSRKVAGSIPDIVIEIFCWRYPSGRTMTLGSILSLREMIIRNISWSGRCVGLTNLPPSCADCLEIREPQSTGKVLLHLCFTFWGNTFPLVFLVSNSFLSFVMWVSPEYVNLPYHRNVIISY